jgi:uncharacterized phage infection (PIP) family protein YhgE
MDQELKGILLRLDNRLENLEGGQKESNGRLATLESGQKESNKRLATLESGQKESNKRLTALESGQKESNKQLVSLESGQTRLEQGQEELKDMLKHHTTILLENVIDIRKDIRINKADTDSDMNLLFKKTENNEREIKKIKRRLGN